jgi:hypothetical protein
MAFPATEKLIPLGPCQVAITIDGPTPQTIVIDRMNNVRVRDAVLKEPILYDEDGAAAADEMNVGDDIAFEGAIARETWENIAAILSEIESSGTAPNELIARVSKVGELDSEVLTMVELRQYVSGQPDATGYKTITFPAMKLTINADMAFGARGQRFLQLQGRAYKDASGRFWYLGTPA